MPSWFLFALWAAHPASGQVQELRVENLQQLAMAAFLQGPGKAQKSEKQGFLEAQERVSPRLEGFSINLLPEMSLQGDGRGEHNVQIEAAISTANLPRMRRALLLSKAATSDDQLRVDALAWTLQVQALFSEAFLAYELKRHVQELHQQAQEQEAQLADQAAKGLVSKVDWLSQKALAGEYAHELRGMENKLSETHQRLEQLLGTDLNLIFPEFADVAESSVNPFNILINQTGPEVLLAESHAQRAHLEAKLAMGQNAPSLVPNIHFREEPGGSKWLGAGLKLSFKTGPKKDANWRIAQAEADAWTQRAAFATTTQKRAWEIRSQHYEKARKLAQDYKTDVLGPLEEQLAMYEKALEAGHLERRIYLDASRRLHEAEHAYLEIALALWSDHTEAQIWAESNREEIRH